MNKDKVMMMYDTNIKNVAKTFLNMESMTPKKLQKLCYYAYVWYLTLHGKKLFPNNFEAWIHGPVDPGLYSEYRGYGWNEIPRAERIPEEIADLPHVCEFLEQVFGSYGHLDGDQLEFLTHSQDPWIKSRRDVKAYEPSKNPIDDNDIISFHSMELRIQ